MTGAGAAAFARRFPVVWHVIEAEGAFGVARHGLLPAAALRALAAAPADGANRPDFQPLPLPGGTQAVLRPQLMPDRALRASLGGRFTDNPAGWRALVDSHVFFWADPRRRDAFLAAVRRARAASAILPGARPPVVLALDTAALLASAGSAAFFTRINSGAAMRGGARVRRDEHTYQPVDTFRSGIVIELAVRGAVRDPAGLAASGGWPAAVPLT